MKFYILDCFATERYRGNQLAVLIPDRTMEADEMQKIAREINFSETAFILSPKQSNGGYDVRIFTPAIEVPFAGHPTLGTAYLIHHILEDGRQDEVRLNLQAGQIPVRTSRVGMTMRQNSPVFGDTVEREVIAEIFNIAPDDIRDDYPAQWVSTGLEAVVVPLKDLDALARCSVNHPKFQAYIQSRNACNHLLFVDTGHSILRARCFMEDPGFAEDPATGSANGNLAGYLLKHDYFGQSSIKYTVEQGVEMGRPSTLHVEASRVEDAYNIEVGGDCAIVAEGDWK